MVKEVAFTPAQNEAGYFYPLEGETDHDGGVIRNAVIAGDINAYKQIEVLPKNDDEMDALVTEAVDDLRIHVMGPHGYDQTFAFTDVTDPYNPSLQITGLPAGEYTVEELFYEDLLPERKWNPTLSWIQSGDGEKQSGETSVTFEVATKGPDNDSVDVYLKNDYTKFDIVATKVWEDHGMEDPDHPAVNLTLHRIDDAGIRSIVGTRSIGANEDGDGLTVKWEQQDQQYTYEMEEAPEKGYACTGITGDIFTGFTVTNTKAAVIKIVKADQSGNPLAGAVFSSDLFEESITTEITDEEGTREAIILGSTNVLPGTYTLTEVSPPSGYIPLEGPVEITVEEGAVAGDFIVSATINGQESAFAKAERVDVNSTISEWVITIRNDAGIALPSTGGFGTTLIYCLGNMLVLLAGAGFFLLNWIRRAG